MSIEHILQALVAILIRPEVTSAMDHTLLNNFHNYRSLYDSNAKSSAKNAAKTFKKWFRNTSITAAFSCAAFVYF